MKETERTLNLREFEKNLKILDRYGKGFWKSKYQSVQNLLDHLSRLVGSKRSRDGYLRTLDGLCRWTGQNPDELAGLDDEEAEPVVQGFVDDLVEQGKGHRRANDVITNLTTFYKSNGHKNFKVDRYYKQKRNLSSTVYVPSSKEIYRIARSAKSHRNRSIIYLLWTTGLRVSTLAALNYGDIERELEEGRKCVKIDVKPEMKERVEGACKGNIPYHTFAHPIALRSLRLYLQIREEKYGSMKDEYPLFHSNSIRWKGKERTKRRLGASGIRYVVKESAKNARIDRGKDVCPASLRKAYKSVLRSPTIDGEILSVEVQEFLMGHVLPGRLEEYYDRGGVERHREMYSRLDFREKEPRGEENSGLSEHGGTDKVVGADGLSDCLDKGWKFIEKIDDGTFVIRKDTSRKDNEKDMRFFLSTREYMKK